MSKIKAVVSKNANYIYHMLSVSKCGYDNPYGDKYLHLHREEDLQALKKWEKHITVRGGEHCGVYIMHLQQRKGGLISISKGGSI
jgi:hypothetical protein